jgi:N-acetylmuramoyl-L-alanine amidase
MEFVDCPSPNHDERDQPVSIVVLHYTGMADAESAIARLRDPAAKVSCHYLVDEDGKVLRMVPEERRAWHAGKSCWRGIHDVNGASVGIEIVNPGHEFGYRPFPAPQMAALLPLLAGIVRRHQVPRANVVGHSDVAPARKQDPGELFDWALLAKHKLAVARPTRDLVDPLWSDSGFLLALERYGYDVRKPSAAVRAFQRRFRPELIDGEIDGECRAILLQLLLDRERGHGD